MTITYETDSTDRIDYITDSVGRKYDFTYSGGYLSKVQVLTASGSVVSGTTVTYTMTDGTLTSVTYSNANTVNYTYDANINMTSVSNVDGCGYGILYEEGTNEVISVIQKAAMGT